MSRVTFQHTNQWAAKIGQLSPSTRAVYFGPDFSIKDEHVAEVASKCPNLLEFTAGSQDTGCGSCCTPAALTTLADNCPKLKTVHLWSFCAVDDNAAIYAAKKLSDLQELTITGHDKRDGQIKGKFLRALAGYGEEYESQMEDSNKDFRRRIKEAMREIINRERAKKGLKPLPPPPTEEERGKAAGRSGAAAGNKDRDGDSDEDEEDEEDYEDDEEDEEDDELEMLKDVGETYFEVLDEGDLLGDSNWMNDTKELCGFKDEYDEPADDCKPGSYLMHDYALDRYVEVEFHKPKHQAPTSFMAPRLRKVHLQDQALSIGDIKKLKDVRKNVMVFSGESCGSGYAAQMVYSMRGGDPGSWW